MTKIYLKLLTNSRCVVGIRGESHDEVEQQFWSFSNRGVGDRFEWVSEKFAVFRCTEKNFKKVIYLSSLAMLLNFFDKEEENSQILELAKQLSDLRMKEVETVEKII